MQNTPRTRLAQHAEMIITVGAMETCTRNDCKSGTYLLSDTRDCNILTCAQKPADN